jgi:GNAT superfamily N-acetyltransferase
MTYSYQILPPAELSDPTIQMILRLWQITEWNGMDAEAFRKLFSASEFHLLIDAGEGALQCIARINRAFTLKIEGELHTFAELVGLVAAKRGKGHGKTLMRQICHNLRERNIEAIGFCSNALRPFYEECGVTILRDRAHYIYEHADAAWIPSEDDDILDINLSPENVTRLRALNEHNVAYFVESSNLS